jgi:stage II sporulation protein D
MHNFPRPIAIVLVIASVLLSPLTFGPSIAAQEVRQRRTQGNTTDKPERVWPSPQTSVVKQSGDRGELTSLTTEPLMRIALSTDARAVTVSTTSHLLNASELNSAPQPLETARVRIESRLLSSARQANDRAFEIEIARSLSRDDAARMVDLVHQSTGESARAINDASDKWRVVIAKGSREEADAAATKLEEAGFEVLSSNGERAPTALTPAPSTPARASFPGTPAQKPAGSNKVQLTSRPNTPSRELLAFAHGAAPLFRSSAPVTFASSDEANAPVRFNDKPFRGRIEVFANPGGALTVVNVIGLEDYVRGVVPNELSPGGFPAIEALKAQAIAARTYALKNRGQFASEGFDLLPTTRSQVYRGLSSEHPLSSRAVDETRGLIATYHGEPINALYTSTCGGRTEDSENIFNEAVPYLRGRECAAEGPAPFAPFMIKSSRELFEIKDEKDLALARDVALLAVNGLPLLSVRVSSSWLSSRVSAVEVREWLAVTGHLARTQQFILPEDATKPPAFSSALVAAVFGDKRADTLLNNADVDYLLQFHDAGEIPANNRADVAMLLRDGHLSLFADATLRPREAMSRSRALHAIARLLEARGLLALQKGTTRPASGGMMMLRSNKGKELPIVVSRDAFLFREFGENLHQMRSLALVGGEPLTFHVGAKGEVDYMEVRPAPNGASAERFSPFTNWTTELSLGEVQARLGRSVQGIGSITDLRIVKRGSSRRVIDLEVVGASGSGHIRGGKIRSALGLREQLFVMDRVYSVNNRVAGFLFTGRGWGHGVGMCQVGAYGLARQGYTAEQILKAYYTGIDLTKLY